MLVGGNLSNDFIGAWPGSGQTKPGDRGIIATIDFVLGFVSIQMWNECGCHTTTSLVPLHDCRRPRHVCEKQNQFPSNPCYRLYAFLIEDNWLLLQLLGRGRVVVLFIFVLQSIFMAELPGNNRRLVFAVNNSFGSELSYLGLRL